MLTLSSVVNSNHALLTPYIDASLAHNANTYTTGLRYQLDNGLNLDLGVATDNALLQQQHSD